MLPTFDYTDMGFDKIFLWSDTHFGHEVVRDNSNRPWKNIDLMDNGILKNAHEVVGQNDLLITVGDLTLHGEQRSNYVEKIIGRLPGKNILVLGNHDRFKPKWYLNRGFVFVATSLVLPGGVLVTHDPADATVWPDDKPVLCGHVHGLFRVLDNVVNVGVDVWNYRPVLLEDALALCSERRMTRDWSEVSANRHSEGVFDGK